MVCPAHGRSLRTMPDAAAVEAIEARAGWERVAVSHQEGTNLLIFRSVAHDGVLAAGMGGLM